MNAAIKWESSNVVKLTIIMIIILLLADIIAK